MSVKNGMPHIKSAVQSIQQQTYGQWEAIIIDDGSTDDTPDFLKSLMNSDDRFKIFLTNGVGRSKALNIAVSHSNGSLIANIDADDIMHPQRIEKQTMIFSNNEDVYLLCSDSIIFFDDETVDWTSKIHNNNISIECVTKGLLTGNPVNHSSVMLRKTIYKTIGGYNENLNRLVDFDFWCRLASKGINIHKIKSQLVAKRIHKNQSYENKKRMAYIFNDFTMRLHHIKNTKSPKKYYLINLAKLIYGFLPQKLRMLLK